MKRLISILLITPILSATAPANNIARIELPPVEQITDDWDVLWIAIAILESGINDNAQNPHSTALGRYQILKGTVDDVNRIKRATVYKYEDRANPVKAREMVEIIQGYYNPERDIRKAIRLHAIGFSKEASWLVYAGRYEEKVMRTIWIIKKYREATY